MTELNPLNNQHNPFLNHWESFREQIYPDGMGHEQEKQIYRAFVAGGFAFQNVMEALSALPEEEAVKGIDVVENEMRKLVAGIIKNTKERN